MCVSPEAKSMSTLHNPDFRHVRRLLGDRVKSVGPEALQEMMLAQQQLPSRSSLDSTTYTASSFMTSSPKLADLSEDLVGDDRSVLNAPSFAITEGNSMSDYSPSPSVASVRQAVVRARGQYMPTLKHQDIQIFAPNPTSEEPTQILTPAQAFKAEVTKGKQSYRLSDAPSLESVSSQDHSNEEYLKNVGNLQIVGPAPGQRMQSFLAPKMTIHSPAPWEDGVSDSVDNKHNNLPFPATPEGGSVRQLKISAPVWPAIDRHARADSPESFKGQLLEGEGRKGRPSLDSKSSKSPTAFSRMDLPPVPISLLPANKRSDPAHTHTANKENIDAGREVNRKSPVKSDSLPKSGSDHSFGACSTDTFQKSPKILQDNALINSSGQTMKLISLDAARSKERDRVTSNQRKAEPIATGKPIVASSSSPPSPSSAQKQLRSKRSGFLKLLKKKDECLPALPSNLATQAGADGSYALPKRTEASQSPYSLSIMVPSTTLSPPGLPGLPPLPHSAPLPTQALRSPSAIAFAPAPSINASDRIPNNSRRHENGLGVPKVNLRPISMAFSANFASSYLFADRQEAEDDEDNPASPPASQSSRSLSSERSPSDLESIMTTPTTPGFPSCLNSPVNTGCSDGPVSPLQSQASFKDVDDGFPTTSMKTSADLFGRIRSLEAEVEALRKERAVLMSRTCKVSPDFGTVLCPD